MKNIISNEVLSEVFGREITDIEMYEKPSQLRITGYFEGFQHRFFFNIHELAGMCILYGFDKMYEITPRVMGAEIVCLKTGHEVHVITREDIKNPESFDPRFIFKACQWLYDNRIRK